MTPLYLRICIGRHINVFSIFSIDNPIDLFTKAMGRHLFKKYTSNLSIDA